MQKIVKKIILIISLSSSNLYASSSIYMNTIDRQHYIARNQATGEEARVKALKLCIETTGTAKKCKLIYKTNYGGYGAIAIGDKSQGYANSLGNKQDADEVSIEECQKKSNPSTCHVVTRWKDEGKIIAIYNDDNYMQQENSNQDIPYSYCGSSTAGLPLDCKTGRDGLGNYSR